MTKPLTLDRLTLLDVRNVERIELEPARHLNVIAGNNGQGKTSVLEAIYALATSRSFRTSKLTELVRHGTETARIGGCFAEHWPTGKLERAQTLELTRRGKHTLAVDGVDPSSLTHYATRSPVVVFEPKQLGLTNGPSAERRTLLDRVTLFTHPEAAAHRARYGRALKERQALLADRHRDRSTELDAYEAILAEHGARLTAIRALAVDELRETILEAFGHIAAPDLRLEVRYAPGGSADAEVARGELSSSRRADAQRKRAGFGPHRDDLDLRLDGHEARVVASQGQHRALTFALKSAELSTIARARGAQPILLLDDVSSELDADRTDALFEHLAATESQIFLTTTRRDLIVSARPEGERADFIVEQGVVRRVA
jgi:DNA replication and repair protein RecF